MVPVGLLGSLQLALGSIPEQCLDYAIQLGGSPATPPALGSRILPRQGTACTRLDRRWPRLMVQSFAARTARSPVPGRVSPRRSSIGCSPRPFHSVRKTR
jgi:hypothetical protein